MAFQLIESPKIRQSKREKQFWASDLRKFENLKEKSNSEQVISPLEANPDLVMREWSKIAL